MIKKNIFSLKNELIFVTGNLNKLNEAKNILKYYNIKNEKIDLKEIQDKSENIISEKIKEAYKILKKPCFVDDTSLEINCLNGLPGPYIKFFNEKIGPKGISKMIENFSDKTAKVYCYIAFCDGEKTKIFKAIVQGKIVKPIGKKGFGFDSIFIPKGYNKTYAQMTNEEKNKVSHRKKVLEKFLKYLKKN